MGLKWVGEHIQISSIRRVTVQLKICWKSVAFMLLLYLEEMQGSKVTWDYKIQIVF